MSWCRLESGYLRHPKTLALCALLKEPHADVYLPRLWAWAAGNLESGTLPEVLARRDFEAAAAWEGPRGQLFDALVRVGFVDVTVGIATLHNWHLYNGHHLRESERLRRRKVANFGTARVHPRVGSDAVRTDGRTDVLTTEASFLRNEPAKPAKRAPPVQLVKPEKPDKPLPAHVALVAAFGDVYLGKEGKPYRYQKPDFVHAAELAKQGVTPEEVRAAAERAWRPGINHWLAVRNFRQFATRFSDIAVAKSSQAQHNVATREELELQEQRLGEVPF